MRSEGADIKEDVCLKPCVMIKRETSVAVSDLHSVSENIKRLAISIDGKPFPTPDKPTAAPFLATSHFNSVTSSNNSLFSNSEVLQQEQKAQRSTEFNYQLNSQMSVQAQQPPTQGAAEKDKVKFSLNVPSPGPGSRVVPVLSQASDGFSERYEILNEVGRGGFSVVYRCRDRMSGEIYAVKVVCECVVIALIRLRSDFLPRLLICDRFGFVSDSILLVFDEKWILLNALDTKILFILLMFLRLRTSY